MATQIGMLNSSQFVPDFKKKSFINTMIRLMPNGTATLFALTSMIKESKAVDTEHGHFSKTAIFPGAVLGANLDQNGTTITVVSSADLLPNMVLRVQETGEVLIVKQIPSNTEVVVTRGVGGAPDDATVDYQADNPRIYQIGTAFEEGSTNPTSQSIPPVRMTNYTQIFRNSWKVTGSAAEVAVIAGNTPVAENRQDCIQFHGQDIESALFFGKKSQGVYNGMPFRTMDGLIAITGNIAYYPPSFSDPNVFTAQSSGTSATDLEDYLDPSFDQVTNPAFGNDKVLFVGGQANTTINRIARANSDYEMVNGETSWGLRFTHLRLTRGSVDIIEHPLFNSNQDWKKMAVAVDIAGLGLAYLGNRKQVLVDREGMAVNKPSIDFAQDASGGSILSELTLEVRNPPANAVIENLVKPLKDDFTAE